MIIPENKIAVITDHPVFDQYVPQIIQPMAGEKRREWFRRHTYFCLPLVIGNQYGFGIRSMYDFTAEWDGTEFNKGVKVEVQEQLDNTPQLITSHFGMGTITIQNRFHFRTPKSVNLMTINPPNTWIDGIQHMTGVIETDNLRRDFTFNIKLTRPNYKVHIKKGDLIGCILPIPRYFPDSFEIVNGRKLFSYEQILEEEEMKFEFQRRREGIDQTMPNRNGRLYARGMDAYERKFEDHQISVKRHPPLTDFD
jgi:hypothetical protein